ncbi:hypothetical protein JTB14_025648 [Gonioctena quinquepunctata]|nr:hypothetical protein JTB14_025648 [Gonioctena quinquepunctata]
MDPSIQSTKSTKKKSVVSKASSTYQRELLEAQVKADEELARIMTIQLEMERKLVENRLALEKAKLEEEAEENIIEGNEESSSEDPKEKVGDWLGNIEQTERKRMLYETSGKRSLKSITCQSQNDNHIIDSILSNEITKCPSHDDICNMNQNNHHDN